MLRRLYPNGKTKVFNVSYDDGVLQDIPFVALLNRYGLKGTFNLNFGLMKQGFQWQHDCGLTISRLSESQAAALYQGHEIASHSFSHPYMDSFSQAEILKELGADRFFLEKRFGREIGGFAAPFYYYSEEMEQCVKDCGFAYARISETDLSYSPWRDYYRWKAGLFHLSDQLEGYVEGFLSTTEELALCQIVGHSYDLDVHHMWERMEAIFQRVSARADVWSATHTEIVQYLRAMEKAIITNNSVQNTSDCPLWFQINGAITALQPGESCSL